MRLWSLHPRHLDSRGLVALWREGLLARHVLVGTAKGYRFHPQLERFRARRDPLAAIDAYLSCVLDEARARGYHFDARKIHVRRRGPRAIVTTGQLQYEWQHLLAKLAKRDPVLWQQLHGERPTPHPCFRVVHGGIAPWERTPNLGRDLAQSSDAEKCTRQRTLGGGREGAVAAVHEHTRDAAGGGTGQRRDGKLDRG